jgi:hypothetical protein
LQLAGRVTFSHARKAQILHKFLMQYKMQPKTSPLRRRSHVSDRPAEGEEGFLEPENTDHEEMATAVKKAVRRRVKKAVRRKVAKSAVKKAVRRKVAKKAVKKAVRRKVAKKAVRKAVRRKVAKKAVRKAVRKKAVKKAVRKKARRKKK